MFIEKRDFTRVPFKVKVEMTANKVLYSIEEIIDLSIGGCLLPINTDLQLGTQCNITILLTGTSPEVTVKVAGEVVRCGNGKMAIKFTRIDPDSLFHLHNIVRYNSRNPETVEWEILNHPGTL